MMSHKIISDKTWWEELQTIVSEAGSEGGCASPSVYDTAQCLRLCPPADPKPVIDWLLNQQDSEGGWCRTATAYQRDVPTLAATVALVDYTNYPGVEMALRLSIQFLLCQAAKWDRSFRSDWPVGVEMTLPSLLDQALAAGLKLPDTLYASLRERRHAWLKKLTSYPVTAGSPLLYCFEAWGTTPDANWLDAEGSIGNSPAATAHWLSLARKCPDLTTECIRAEEYLRHAACVTDMKTGGIYPTLWPLPNFERAFLLHTLQIVGLIHSSRLETAVTQQSQALFAAIRPSGVGYSETFMSDGDDTGAAACALIESGYNVDPEMLHRYAAGNHFVTYPGELDPSLSTTARVAQALQLQGEALPEIRNFFKERQLPDGRWVRDKWHGSWLYVTFLVLAFMAPAGELESVCAAGRAICLAQNKQGAWEAEGVPSRMDTVFAILALTVLCRHGYANQEIGKVYRNGLCWLRQHQYSPFPAARLDWIAKTAYTVPRVDRCFELCALLSACRPDLSDRPHPIRQKMRV